MNSKLLSSLVLLSGALSLVPSHPARAWAPKKAPLMTRWAAKVDPAKPLPEYPRPQLVRSEWLNLNGVWQFEGGAKGDLPPVGTKLSSEILVPFAVESALSGVMEQHDRLWYRRTFSVPPKWNGKQLMLHFGAVDYEAEIFVNGQSVGVHRGGYEQFSFDITRYLKGSGPQELIVRVFDPTDLGGQPRGKQTLNPAGIMYTPVSGIWQTVWLEPVARTSIQSLKMVPDIDRKTVRFTVNASSGTRAIVKIKDGNRVVRTIRMPPGVEVPIPMGRTVMMSSGEEMLLSNGDLKLWSPDKPFLYNVEVTLFNNNVQTDRVTSYFGMRKISVGMSGGVPKMLLNNQFVFQMGPLDQGYWPDGLYTAPTDEALRYDIEMTKKLGFNMSRKHIKVEPARWYYHADKLGLLVWQDMPSPNSYTGNPAPLDKAAFEQQLKSVITSHWNSPSIVMWVIFNEGQARHDTIKLSNIAKTLDPSRLINRDSGAGYEGADNPDGVAGDVDDVHNYPPPASPPPASTMQALACGEYGGIGYIIPGHTWKKEGWGYTTINSAKELEELYGEFTGLLKQFRDEKGMSAAVYTEITDVEIEANGLMTYDRILKCDPEQIALANRFQYPVPVFNTIIPTSEQTKQTWKYTFSAPPADWNTSNFNDANWQTGLGGFGTAETPGSTALGTVWNTPDIWMRRTFTLGNLSPEQVSQLVIRDIHDEDVEVFINGVLAYESKGFIGSYEHRPMREEAKRSLVLNGVNTLAVHCHQTAGGQFVDVGISQRIEPKK